MVYWLYYHCNRTIGDKLLPIAGSAPYADSADAVAKGATVLVGGKSIDGPGWFYQPTALGDLTDDMRIVMEEAFGPVASIYKVADRDEAIRIANQTTFGLSSAVWTNDAEEEAVFIRDLDAGAVFINGMTVSYPELPFGGIKDSGFGREGVRYAMEEMTELKSLIIKQG